MGTTRGNVREKVICLLDDIRPHLEKKLDILLDSCMIDFDEEDNNYLLPKQIMQALAREMEFQYTNINATRKEKRRINQYYRTMRLFFNQL